MKKIFTYFILFLLGFFGYKGLSLSCNKYFNKQYENADKKIKENLKKDSNKVLSALIYSAVGAFDHKDAIKAFKTEIRKMGIINNWYLEFSNDPSLFNNESLKNYDVVIWNNSTGNTLDEKQMNSFENYIENGGGYVGIHGAGDSSKKWKWYYEVLLKARFSHHPNREYQFQNGTLEKKCNSNFSKCEKLPNRWDREEEWYVFNESPKKKGSNVIYNLNVRDLVMTNIKDGVIRESSMGDDHPIVWTNCVGKGKAFYSAMGHKGKYFLEPLHLEVIKSGIIWVANKSAKCN